jgi:hypothetical protein
VLVDLSVPWEGALLRLRGVAEAVVLKGLLTLGMGLWLARGKEEAWYIDLEECI